MNDTSPKKSSQPTMKIEEVAAVPIKKKSSSWLIIATLILFFIILATQQTLKRYYQTPLYEIPAENQLRFFTFI